MSTNASSARSRSSASEYPKSHSPIDRSRQPPTPARRTRTSVEGLARVLHEVLHRLDGALGGHHGRRADLEDLHDRRALLGTEGSDRRGQRLGIGALVDGVDLVLGLRLVELVGHLCDRFAQCAAHGVPPLDLGLCGGALRARQHGDSSDGRQHDA